MATNAKAPLAYPSERGTISKKDKVQGRGHMVEKSNWRAILSAFFVGVAGAIQVGRVAPVATFIQEDLRLDLLTVGWLVSLITLASAAFGLIAGHWVVRAGLRTSLVIGAFAMGACAVTAALLPTAPLLIGARIVEGVGYLVVVVAAPTLIAREAAQKAPSISLCRTRALPARVMPPRLVVLPVEYSLGTSPR